MFCSNVDNFKKMEDQDPTLASSGAVHAVFKDQRARRTKKHFFELCEDERLQNVEEYFKVNVFYRNIDIAISQHKKQFDGMNQIVQLFSFLLPCDLEAPDEALSVSASALEAQYAN